MAPLTSFNVRLPKFWLCTSPRMSIPGHYHNHYQGIDFHPQMSFAYAIGTAINWGNEAYAPTFTATFGLNQIVMISHKREVVITVRLSRQAAGT